MSAATDAIRAELDAARRERMAIGLADEKALTELKAAIAKRDTINQEHAENGKRIDALERALELLDPQNET